MREMHQSSSGRSRSAERGSTHLKKPTVVSSDRSQNYYSISPELSRSSSKKFNGGVPMKCLIEEELTMKEKRTRHPSPGVIARLMGLDTLPPSPPPSKPYNTDHHHRGPHCHKKKIEDELPEFKDVYEITEVRKGKKKLHSSPVHSKNSSPDEVEFVRQKFADAKRLSTDESLRSCREFDDTIEALESNRDALLQFLSEPNYLFKDNMTFLPSPPHQSARQITILKPSSKRTTPPGGVNSEDDFVSLTFDKPIKSANYNKFRGEKSSPRPTNIVVLKPSLDKARRTVGAGAFPVFYPEGTAKDSFVGGTTRAKSSREIARQVTRQMRRAVSGSKLPNNNYSPDLNPLYEFNPLYDDRSYYASPKVESSSVSKEARKRLSDRWKTTHRVTDEVGPLVGGGSNTLGDMLTLSDVIMSSDKPPPRKDKFLGGGGISSNDGWKDGNNFRNLPRSKSLPSRAGAAGHRSSGHRRRGSRASEFGMLRDVLDVGPTMKGEKTHNTSDVSEGEDEEESVLTEREIHVNSEELLKSKSKKGMDEVKKIDVGPTEEDAIIGEETTIPFEAKQLEAEDAMLVAVTKDMDVVGPTLDDDVDEKQEVMEHIVCSKEGEEQQLSPNSTLDSPFEEVADEDEEETSTSGCFEKISADLQELRMQLNLLKMDSIGGEQGGDNFLLSDEEEEETTDCCLELLGNRDPQFRNEEERDFLYLLDIVTDLVGGRGGQVSTRDELLSLCYSLDCPVGPATFPKLEKKYGGELFWPKSERKLLFDLINSILAEILAGKRLTAAFQPKKWDQSDIFAEEVWRKVVERRREIECGGEEMFLETKWSALVEEENGLDLVGREIECVLHEDLLCELVTELVSFY